MNREVGVLQSKGSQRVKYNLATEQQPLAIRLILLKVKPSLQAKTLGSLCCLHVDAACWKCVSAHKFEICCVQ